MTANDLVILYEDNHILVVLKPQNVPCCEDSSKDPDLLSAIREYIKVTYSKPGNVYVGLVHRLDRPTGGVMVYAKSSKAAARLSEQLKSGDFEKKYFAVLVGCPREKKAVLTDYLKKNAVNNMVYVCGQTVEGAKLAELDYKILEEKGELSLADIRLHTGRSHQIRVQMSHLGTPVYGDMRYGGEKAKKGYLALWAYTLSFSHPVTKERMVFKVQPPKDAAPWSEFDLEKPFAYINPKNA
ncbi:MAG: RluA family pseudouridine synthase [Clostridia bacterium]|nr:RluA family pseudouridine synthase [Clostridia bacterium]MBR2969258.1 RluA family pseudouridine synthase [Clostridia bacterium]